MTISCTVSQVSLQTAVRSYVASNSAFVPRTNISHGYRQYETLKSGNSSGRGIVNRRRINVSAGLASVTEIDFEKEVLQSDLPVLVDFWATWCGPCKLVLPAVEGISKDYEGKLKVVKIDVDAAPQLVEKYKVYGLPFMVLFDKGEVLVNQEGAINRKKLEALLASKLPALAA